MTEEKKIFFQKIKENPSKKVTQFNSNFTEGMIQLGKKLENPFSVDNMRKAWSNLKKANSNARLSEDSQDTIAITPTHLYIKFIPQNEEELDILKDDTVLILYDYPLDHEITHNGSYYRDPDVPLDQPTPQYCAVEIDHGLPQGVEYEILAELFIPDEHSEGDGGFRKSSRKAISDKWADALVTQSLQMTGNLEEEISDSKDGDQANFCIFDCNLRSWRPAGIIRVWDDAIITTVTTSEIVGMRPYNCGGTIPEEPSNPGGPSNPGSPANPGSPSNPWAPPNPAEPRGIPRSPRSTKSICYEPIHRTVTKTVHGSYVPVQGAIVRARRWFTTHRGGTNSQGYYSCDGTFKRDANYSIRWERHDFSIRSGSFGQACMNGPKKTGNWNVDIKYGEQEYYATIFRATHHYYYMPIKNLRRPPMNGFGKPQMKIAACYEDNDIPGRFNPYFRTLGLLPQIYIWDPYRNSDQIYSTTIHELAHAAHWRMDSYNYLRMNDCSDTPGTLFCSGSQKVVESWARGVEWDLTRMVYPDYRGGASGVSIPNYTQVVVDMIDGPSLIDINNGSENLAEDNVTGYTIRQIEDALYGEKTWDGWRDNIIGRYNNPTEHNLSTLFNYWNR